MEFSNILAATALFVSIISVWLSYKAHRESTLFSEREARREFSRERSEFLIRIERSNKIFERTEIRIQSVLDSIESQPDKIKSSLAKQAGELRADLKYLEGCLRQSRILWDENFDMTHDGLAHHKARHLALLEDDEEFAEQALARADKAEESLSTYLSINDPIIG